MKPSAYRVRAAFGGPFSDGDPLTNDAGSRKVVIEALHIFILTSFAIAQPVFDLWGRNPTFLVAHRAMPAQVLLLASLVLLIPPALLLTIKHGLAAISNRTRDVSQLLAVGLLFGLIVSPPLAQALDSSPVAASTFFLLASAIGAYAYARLSMIRTVLTWLAPAPLIFLGVLFIATPVRQIVFPTAIATAGTSVSSRTPVVLVIFDELALSGILDADGGINRHRFPNFARLGDMSTWYPNATTVHPQSRGAVPSILSGSMPESNAVPTAEEFPTNVFTLLGDSYTLKAEESVTNLCPPALCDKDARDGSGGRFISLTKDTGVAYLHTIVPKDIGARWLPPIDDRWTGFTSAGSEVVEGDDQTIGEVIQAREEDIRLNNFLDSLVSTDTPTLYFLHSVLPHGPWRYLPTGQIYENDFFGGILNDNRGSVWRNDERYTNQGIQRFLLQTAYVDRLLGHVLDKMETIDILDESLLIVIADHGISFEPGTARRGLDIPVTGDGILPIPLFVKYPHQESGTVDRRYAQTIDVLPTIADVLNIPLNAAVDGSSLARPEADSDPGRVVTTDGLLNIPSDLLAKVVELARSNAETFGDGSEPFDMYGMGPHRHMLGTSVDTLKSSDGANSIGATISGVDRLREVDPAALVVPARLTGTLAGEVGESELALSLNGVLASIASSYYFPDDDEWRFSFFVPPSLFARGCNDAEMYLIEPNEMLRRVELSNHLACS